MTLDASGQLVCAFTVDTDLTGTNDKAILHIAGGLTVHWQTPGGREQPVPRCSAVGLVDPEITGPGGSPSGP